MNFWLIYDLLFLLAGCYGISLYAKVSESGDLNDIKLLMPRRLKPEECLDPEDFLRRIKPWILAFSGCVIFTGAVGAMENLGLGLPHEIYMGGLGLCVAAALAFVIFMRRAADENWEQEEEEPQKRGK